MKFNILISLKSMDEWHIKVETKEERKKYKDDEKERSEEV